MRTLAILTGLTILASLGAQDNRWWVYFDSRESDAGGPMLYVKSTDGFEATLEPTADAALLAYLGPRNFGTLKTLPVGVGDQNRSLVRFRLPRELKKKTIAKAELLLDLKMGKRAPKAAVQVAVHAVTARWKENKVTWNNQPKVEPKPVAVLKLEPKPARLRVDITALCREWKDGKRKNHGVVFKSEGSTLKGGLVKELTRTLPWLSDAVAALAKGRRDKRLVLSLVRPAYSKNSKDESEELLLAAVFTDPRIVWLVERRFVPLRTGYRPTNYTHGRVRGRDPLQPLGADCTRIKAPALCVSTPDGELLASLDSIGTFDTELVYAFLTRALSKSEEWSRFESKDAEKLLAAGELGAAEVAFGKLAQRQRDHGRCRVAARRGDHAAAAKLAAELRKGKDAIAADAHVQAGISAMRQGDFAGAAKLLAAAIEPKPQRVAEALYWLGCVQRATGQHKASKKTFERLFAEHEKELWGLKARVRLAWPQRIGPAENLRAFALDQKLTRTERGVPEAEQARLVQRALRYLLEQQRADGSWPCQVDMYRDAVTAIAAKSVEVWIPKQKRELRRDLEAASERAFAWITKHVENVNPKEANSFGSAYILDYLLARHERLEDQPSKTAVQAAVVLLEKGQCPNGAWSYSYRFGTWWKGGFGGWPRTDRGRTHSCNTGPAMVFLARAKKRGFKVSQTRLEEAAEVLEEMRKDAGVYTYTFPDPISFQRADQSIARGPVCEHALFAVDEASRDELGEALAQFMKLHKKLRAPVKLDKAWATPNNFSSYFYFYAYYHAADAMRALGGDGAKKMLAVVRAEILSVAEVDGTWVDFPQVGKPYGTAMALLILQ